MKINGRDKWRMYLAMKKNKKLSKYLVDTKRWSKENFDLMLSKYKSIVVKPNKGLKARDIYFIAEKEKGYEIQIYDRKYFFIKREEVYSFMKSKIRQATYIIQKRISMAKIDGRPFDIRVIIQRKSLSSPWTATAYKIRVAKEGRMVTNASKGGTILTYKVAMNMCNIPNHIKKNLLAHIKEVSILASKTLGPYYHNQRLFGIDIGIKEDGSLHIFEINRRPLLKGFSKLQQKRIRRFIRRK
ncbi:YheC/YheD family protein [Halalkalibacter flavus]|jgi:glutathione synthase/RimK-type ligase-like ATP-grasp enzyme|uniref:YheC/YheD family protein n=1 Tax=Halalkalibacter flavus TaxID=3090668 RepID=UPI002FCA37CF